MKKTFQQIVSKFWYILLCTIVVSCSNSDSPTVDPSPEPTPEPEPVVQNYRLKDGVNEIKGSNLDYIVEANEGTTLVLSNNYPSDEVPVVGEIVFVYPNAEKLPFGFLGKVSEINQSGGNYNLVTEQVTLDEAFSYLSVNETIDMELYAEGEEIAESRAFFENINGYQCKSQEISGKLKLYDDALSLEVVGKVTCGIRRNTSILVNDTTDINSTMVTFCFYVSVDGKMHFLSEINNDNKSRALVNKNKLKEIFKKPIFKVNLPPNIASFFATPSIDVNLATKAEAALSLGLGFNFSNESALSVICENGVSRLVQEKLDSKESTFTLLPNSEISVKGNILVGAHLKPIVRLFNRDDMNVHLECAVGPRVGAEIEYDPINDKSVYDALKDDKISASLAFVAEAGGNFTNKFEWSNPWVDVDLKPFYEGYIFPDFTDCTIEKVEDGKYNVASTTLKRDILFNTSVGIAAFDEDDSIMFETKPKTYRLEKDFEKLNPLELKFENTDENNKYSIWSYVKWGEEYVKCERLDPDIIGLWCQDEGWFRGGGHVEFRDGTIHYYDKKNGVWNNYYTRPWIWNEDEDDILWIFDDGELYVDLDEVWQVQKLTADSLVLLDLTESGTPYWEENVVRFHRINSHLECTVQHEWNE